MPFNLCFYVFEHPSYKQKFSLVLEKLRHETTDFLCKIYFLFNCLKQPILSRVNQTTIFLLICRFSYPEQVSSQTLCVPVILNDSASLVRKLQVKFLILTRGSQPICLDLLSSTKTTFFALHRMVEFIHFVLLMCVWFTYFDEM